MKVTKLNTIVRVLFQNLISIFKIRSSEYFKNIQEKVRKQRNVRRTLSHPFAWKFVICVPSILYRDSYYTLARTHTLFLKSILRTKGHPTLHECGAISRHRYPQFNTRLRLRRVTAVNFRSRPIYCMHVTLGMRV